MIIEAFFPKAYLNSYSSFYFEYFNRKLSQIDSGSKLKRIEILVLYGENADNIKYVDGDNIVLNIYSCQIVLELEQMIKSFSSILKKALTLVKTHDSSFNEQKILDLLYEFKLNNYKNEWELDKLSYEGEPLRLEAQLDQNEFRLVFTSPDRFYTVKKEHPSFLIYNELLTSKISVKNNEVYIKNKNKTLYKATLK